MAQIFFLQHSKINNFHFCEICGYKKGLTTVPRAQMKKTKVRPDYSSAPTQLALCLRFASMYKAESCYALQPSMTRLHNEELVN
jgi:hypothetical protein